MPLFLKCYKLHLTAHISSILNALPLNQWGAALLFFWKRIASTEQSLSSAFLLQNNYILKRMEQSKETAKWLSGWIYVISALSPGRTVGMMLTAHCE